MMAERLSLVCCWKKIKTLTNYLSTGVFMFIYLFNYFLFIYFLFIFKEISTSHLSNLLYYVLNECLLKFTT